MIEIGPADEGAVCMNEACCMYAHPCPEDCKIHDAGGGNPPIPAVMNISMGPTDDDSHNRCDRCAGKMLVELVKTTFVSGGSETIIIMSDEDPEDDGSEKGADGEDAQDV